MSKEAMKLALEALEIERNVPRLGPVPTKTSKAITALREALAEQPAPMIRGDIRDGLVDDEPAQQSALCAPAADGVCESLDCPNHKPAQQALDKKAENARELGLDYEPAQTVLASAKIVSLNDMQGVVDWLPHNGAPLKAGDYLYTSPPAQRKPLTDDEIDKLCPQFEDPIRREMWIIGFKAAHGIKENT